MALPHTPRSRFMARIRELAAGDAGAAHPMLLLGAILVFGIVSVAFGGGLTTSMTTMQQQKVNGALASQVNTAAIRETSRGFPTVSALPAVSNISITVAGTTVTAQRLIQVNTGQQTATVTVRAGRYTHGTWESPAACDATPNLCVSASGVSTPTMAQTFPKVSGVAAFDTTGNVPESSELNWRDVAAGPENVVAIDADGNLWAWGTNVNGEAGQDSTDPVLSPQMIEGVPTTFTQVSAGSTSMYALDVDGRLWSWGSDANGRLGNGSAGATPKPAAVAGSQRWLQISAGTNHACAIDKDRAVHCWGRGTGAFRSGSSDAQSPVRIRPAGETATSAAPTRFSSIAAGQSHQLAVDDAGTVYAWGKNPYGELGLGLTVAAATVVTQPTKISASLFGSPVVSVSVSTRTSFAIDAYGRLYGFGLNTSGQLGDATKTTRNFPVRAASNVLFQSVSANLVSTIGVDRAGKLYSWGAPTNQMLGDGTGSSRTTPAEVTDSAAFASLAVSTTSGWAIDSTHRLWSWGAGTPGIWGEGTASSDPRPIAVQNRIRASGGVTVTGVAAGFDHSVALGDDGSVWAWGANSAGQLGNDSTTQSSTSVQAAATYTDQPNSVAVGADFILVAGKLGTIVGSGQGTSGQLGGDAAVSSPVSLGTLQVATMAAGARHTVAISRDTGKVLAWGANEYGQLGNGGTTASKTPVPVGGLPEGLRFVDVAAGAEFSMALAVDGTVWTWGRNEFGQLGDGSTADRQIAGQILAAHKVVQIGAGVQHAIAVTNDIAGGAQALYTWGRNDSYQLGQGAADALRAIPASISWDALDPIVAVDGGQHHSVALTASGKALTWGGTAEADNTHGSSWVTRPKVIGTIVPTKFSMIDASEGHTVALDAAGNVWAWGTNTDGRMGIGGSVLPAVILSGANAVAVAAGAGNTVVVTASGATHVTGRGDLGQLGNGATGNRATLAAVPEWGSAVQAATAFYAKSADAWRAVPFARVSAGGNTTAAIDFNGHLWMWGQGTASQLGNGLAANAKAPQLANSQTRFLAVSVGDNHVLALGVDGSVWAFGSSASNAAGRAFDVRVPARISIPTAARTVAAGSGHSVVLSEDGKSMYGWGKNDAAQIGVSTGGTARLSPTVRDVGAASTVVAGDRFTTYQDIDGRVVTVGSAPWAASSSTVPTGATGISASGRQIAAVSPAESNMIRGYTAAGPISYSTSRYTDVAAARDHMVALDVNGSVWAWGNDSAGELGGAGAAGGLVPQVGDPSRTVFSAQLSPTRTTTTWPFASIQSGASGMVQVNVSAGVPLLSVVVDCVEGRKHMAPPTHSSGPFSYANISLDGMDGCTSPTLAAVLDGAPVNAADVTIVIAPLVYASNEVTP